jgi:hypothetical protein
MLLDRIGALSMEATVGPRLEQAAVRAMRHAAAVEEEASERRWWRMPALSVLAVAASLAAVAVGLRRYAEEPSPPAATPLTVARPVAPRPAPSPAKAPPELERAEVARGQVSSEPPSEPPPELAARPDLFVELPILRHMEKLEHLEAIQATSVGDGAVPSGAEGERSSG